MHPDPIAAIIWIFIIIFIATAVIALASLPGWIRIPDYYRKKLFALLVLEVIGCVVGFGREALKSYTKPTEDFRSVLLSPEYGWDWQYAQKSWRSRITFKVEQGRKLSFTGDTWVVDPSGNVSQPIIRWQSTQPFDVPANAKSISFQALRTWTKAAADKYPELKWEIDKPNKTTITFELGYAVHGSATDPNSSRPWGIMLTTAFPD
jgi:hypothetical protein